MFDYSSYPLEKTQVEFLESCAQGVEAGVKITVEGILEIGKALSAAREIFGVNDKAFGEWRSKRLPFLERCSVLRFIQVYEKFGKNDYQQHNVAVECYTPTLLYLLSAPSTPESVVTDITARVNSGEKVKVKEVQAAIKAAKSNIVDFPKNPQSDLPIPQPKPQPVIVDANPMMRQLGIPDGWLSRFSAVHRDLQGVYNRHFAGNDRDLFVSDFIAAMPADTDLTCVFQLSDFLVKLIASLPRRERSHG